MNDGAIPASIHCNIFKAKKELGQNWGEYLSIIQHSVSEPIAQYYVVFCKHNYYQTHTTNQTNA